MCGIAGIISPYDREDQVRRMLELQKHRGPDNTGIYKDKGYTILGHNRLSIIDLSQAANQPFQDNSGRFQIIFNGEIYNYQELKQELKDYYQFRTSSDTEVLLAAYLKYGKACLNKLNGMFAFSIWDSKEKLLFAARDRFGVKPFYYFESSQEFLFASEIKGIKAIKTDHSFSEKAWANYFAYGSYAQPDETFYKDIYQLPAGHFLTYQSGSLHIEKWYDFVHNVKAIKVSEDFKTTSKEYYDLLVDSIALRFRADVNIGFNISGGVDSSLLLALVNQYEKINKIKAYTFYTGNDSYDELPWVEKMIAHTGNPLTKVKLEASEIIALTRKISDIQDEPFGGFPSLAYSKIFQQARKENTIVLLDGQGMDEQWAGYDYYKSNSSHTIQGLGKKSPYKKNCIHKDLLKYAEKPEFPEPFHNQLQNLQFRDLFYTKLPRALRFNDRISMTYSTELREPFLDYRLVEFAFAQPDNFKIRGNTHKYLLREITKDLVPKDISYAPKRALQTPQREWLGNELKDFASEELGKLKSCRYSNWFDHTEIATEWQKYLNGNNKSSFHIWQWINAAQLLS